MPKKKQHTNDIPIAWPVEVQKPKPSGDVNDLLPQIVGGVQVDPIDRYPYQVALVYDANGGQYCAGSLITPMWVLSAAHCAGYGTYVQIGRWNLLDNTEVYENIEVDYELPHPDYNSYSFDKDFMLIKLKTASQYPPVSIDDGNQFTSNGLGVTVMGWGTLSSGGQSSAIMREVEVDIVGNSECNNDYSGGITDNMMCAARSGKDACQGDSGGPLIIRGNSNAEDVLVGVVSWGYGCASASYPGVYARVSEGYSWITSYVDLGPTASPTTGPPTFSPAPTITCQELVIEIRTDTYPSETNWEVEDPSGNTVSSGSGTTCGNEQLCAYNYCVLAECGYEYTFTITDTFGDGICCSYGDGYYTVTYAGVEVVQGGDFSYSEETSFGCPVESVTCVDSPLNADAGGGNLGCDFVASSLEYCAFGGNSHCPLSCGTCDTYECEDSGIEFLYGGGKYDCAFLASASQEIKDIGCAIDDVVKTCRSTCGYCDE